MCATTTCRPTTVTSSGVVFLCGDEIREAARQRDRENSVQGGEEQGGRIEKSSDGDCGSQGNEAMEEKKSLELV